jgi:hypothetical protein
MRTKDSYEDFLDRMFQEIDDLADLQKQIANENAAPFLNAAKALGLSVEEALTVYRDGMNGQQLADAMKSMRKK